MPVGDVHSQALGSGARYNDGKPDWSIMPLTLLEEVVRVWEYGEKKYARWNWAKGMKWSVPYACIMRHMFAWWWRGERNDPESGYHHLAHVICNVMMLLHYETKYQEGDDRPGAFKPSGPNKAGFNQVPDRPAEGTQNRPEGQARSTCSDGGILVDQHRDYVTRSYK